MAVAWLTGSQVTIANGRIGALWVRRGETLGVVNFAVDPAVALNFAGLSASWQRIGA